MSKLQTKVAPCVRFVFVRNAQCKKHIPQQTGEFTDCPSGKASVLTPQGEQMAKAFTDIIGYLDRKPFCSQNVPDRHYHFIIDQRAPQHGETADHVILDREGIDFIFSSDVLSDATNLEHIHVNPDGIDVYIVFTDSGTIRDILDHYTEISNIGPALGSTTIFDYIPSEPIETRTFIHTVGSLEALQWGGFDTSKLFWWNNAA